MVFCKRTSRRGGERLVLPGRSMTGEEGWLGSSSVNLYCLEKMSRDCAGRKKRKQESPLSLPPIANNPPPPPPSRHHHHHPASSLLPSSRTHTHTHTHTHILAPGRDSDAGRGAEPAPPRTPGSHGEASRAAGDRRTPSLPPPPSALIPLFLLNPVGLSRPPWKHGTDTLLLNGPPRRAASPRGSYLEAVNFNNDKY